MVFFNKTTLKNGLRILCEERESDISTIMFAVPYGAMYEEKEEKGIAHFIEHLCFKGTEKRNTKEIAKTLEKYGGELNAFTHEEMTAYHVKIPNEFLEIAIDVLSDVFFNPIFPKEEIEKERNVILEEIKMYYDNPRAHCYEKIKENLFSEPYGLFTAGSEESLIKIDREKLLKKHRTIYCPENCILCVVGGNKFEDVVNISNKYISSIERKGEKLRDISIEKRKRNNYENRNNLSQANLCLGIHFPSFSNELRYSAEIFNMILGVGMSSKLFSEVREKRGLVYGIRSELDLGRNYGYMVIWAGCDKKNISEVIKISKEEFEKMKDINEQELEDAKIQLIGSRKVHNSGLNEVAINLIMEEFNSNAKNYYEYEKKINNVKREEIKKLCTNLDFASYYLI